MKQFVVLRSLRLKRIPGRPFDFLASDAVEDLDAEIGQSKSTGENVERDNWVPRSLTEQTITVLPSEWDNERGSIVNLKDKLGIIRERCRGLKLDIRRDDHLDPTFSFTCPID